MKPRTTRLSVCVFLRNVKSVQLVAGADQKKGAEGGLMGATVCVCVCLLSYESSCVVVVE